MKNIENKFLIEIKNCELNLWDEEEQNEHAKECVKIAEEFAIGFANWTHNLRNECKKDSAEYNKWKNISNKELLEIYKKEKGL